MIFFESSRKLITSCLVCYKVVHRRDKLSVFVPTDIVLYKILYRYFDMFSHAKYNLNLPATFFNNQKIYYHGRSIFIMARSYINPTFMWAKPLFIIKFVTSHNETNCTKATPRYVINSDFFFFS